jgi:hypothetical protein
MLALPLSTMRRRVGGLGRATVLSLFVLAPPHVAAEIAPLYLRWDHHLVIAAPTSTEPRDDVSASVGAGQQAVLAEFRSDPLDEEADATGVSATLFLVTGKEGMPECAEITVEIARRNPPDQRTVVGSGSVLASILPRRQTVDPIEVPVPLAMDGVVALPGEQIAITIAVENRCDDLRVPALLYDALGLASVVRFSDDVPTTMAPTTTTSTTTSTAPQPRPTTTTLPWPAGCLSQPLSGFDAVFCRLDTLAETLNEEDAVDVGGQATYARLQRRLGHAHDLVGVAQTGRRTRRHLRQALQQLGAFTRAARRQGRQGNADPDLIEELTGLASAAVSEIGFLR